MDNNYNKNYDFFYFNYIKNNKIMEYFLSENNIKIIGIFHLFFAIFMSLYGILFKKSFFDYFYIFYTILLLISWTMYNGECLLTYYIKKHLNNNYICGQDSTDLKDMYLLTGSKTLTYIFVFFTIFLNTLSEYIVLKRNNYPNYIYYGIPISHLIYNLMLRFFINNLYKNKLFLILKNIFKFYFIIMLILLIILKIK